MTIRHSACRIAAALLVLCFAFAAAADVRPISEAERAAVQFAAEYLAGGPPAFTVRLASSSPLRALAGPLKEAEIETRLGPPAGAKWQLITVVEALQDKTAAFEVSYASGIDDTIFFDLVQEGGQTRVQDVRMMAMPVPGAPLFPPAPTVEAVGLIGHRLDTIAGIAGVAAAILALLTVFMMPFHSRAARLLFLVAFLVGAGAVVLAGWKGERLRVTVARAAEPTAKEQYPTLFDLVVLRGALAAGGEGVGAALADVPQRDGLIGDVVKLWRAQWQFRQGNLDEVQRALESFPLPSRTPLVEVMRARLALARNDSVGAAVAYQRAVNLGPGRDALWLEASSALAVAGFEAEAKKELLRVARLGSREASIYYATASLATEAEDTETLLQRAWTLQPAERSRLVESGVIWSLMRRRGPTMINLSEPHEATLASPVVSSRAIALPAAATAAISGELLHVAVKDAELFVPSGACLAPAGTPAVDAGRWSRLREERSMRDAPALLASPPPLASYMQPALRDRIVAAAGTLSEHNRWSDVVTLTQGIAAKSEFVPADLFFLRATALQHLDRDAEAKTVLMELTTSPVLDRRKDPYVLQQLGDMLASYDIHDGAMKVFERSRAIRADGYAELRLMQIEMDKRLATQYSTHKSANFEIRYPPEVSSSAAAGIARVLEGELQRMQRWIPVPSFKPVIVNIVWWQDFKQVYTGSDDVLGFYTGKITLPLAGIYDLSPGIVSLITHELAHAMLAQATNDQAPRWLHEGLAQRMEMVPYAANAFNMYEDDKLLAVSVLDAVLATSRDGDMVGEAYIVAQTFVRYLEASLGEAGMRSLIGRYAQGATTEEAIAAVAGRPLADVDATFRTWGRAEKRVFQNPAPVRYDQGEAGATEQTKRRERGSMGKGTFYPFRAGKGQQ
jgi:hypothetical protein